MFDSFSHVMIFVNDMPRAVAWYCDRLGFTPIFVAETFYASLRHKAMGCQIDLHYEESKANIGVGAMAYFKSKNFDETLAKLKAEGVETGEVRSESGSPRFCSFKDSEGNLLGLQEA